MRELGEMSASRYLCAVRFRRYDSLKEGVSSEFWEQNDYVSWFRGDIGPNWPADDLKTLPKSQKVAGFFTNGLGY